MPRSSRHKSSKHSSREARDYSESDKDYGLKEKKGRDDGGSSSSRHLKESASGEKRKLDFKSVDITEETINIDSLDDYGASSSSSLKKRKEKVDDDRWTGGDNNEHELSKSEMKELKGSGDSKRSSRRDENLAPGFEGEEGKRGVSKVESKHHRSDRKERSEKEGGVERERKGSRSERFVDGGVVGTDNTGNEGNRKQGGSIEERGGKHAVGNTDFNKQDEVRNSETEREVDRRVRRKREGSIDGEKHQDGVREIDDKRLSVRDDTPKSGKYKDDGHKEERNKNKYREDVDKDNWHHDEKQRDSRNSRGYTSGRSDDKHLRNEKKDLDVSEKKSKSHGSEYERDQERERDHDRDRHRDHDRDRVRSHHDRERGREHDDRDHDLDRDRDRELDQDRERGRERYRRERDRDRIRDRDRDHYHDRGRDRDYDYDHDYGSHVDDKGSRYKEDRGRRRSPDGYDGYHDDKPRRVELEVDKERSLSRKAHVDSRRISPSSRSYVGTDKYRDGMQDEVKYGDSLRDGTSMSETLDKVSKHRSGEKPSKFDENHVGELPERSPSTKASPAGVKERSPSSNSVDRRFVSRNVRRRSLDVDESERRSSGSNDVRDVSINEERQGRDFSAKKPMAEEYPQAESSFYNKSNQGHVSSRVLGPSGFRAGADSPSFIGSMGEDSRVHSGNRYRRSVDPHVGRGPGNAWKAAVPNWHSPLPNGGFMPFPPGPPGPHHGGFPPMLSQFPPLFGVRPSLDMNHPGMPYHMGDGDRFPGHVRPPMGWQNMVDGSIPPHFHGWDANNGALRDDSSMYGPGNLSTSRGRDMNAADLWKPNGDVNTDVTTGSQKEGHMNKASADEASSAHGAPPRLPHGSSHVDDHGTTSLKMNASSGPSSTKDLPMTPAKVMSEKTPESSSVDDSVNSLHTYLTTLDISIDLANPELYNQCITLAVKGQTEIEEDLELEYVEEKAVVESGMRNLTMGMTFFPAAKVSIFQVFLQKIGNNVS